MTDREIVRALSISEFARLCALVDEYGPAQTIAFKHGDGSESQVVAGSLMAKRFKVIHVRRDTKIVLAQLEFAAQEFGQVQRQWYELKLGQSEAVNMEDKDVQVA